MRRVETLTNIVYFSIRDITAVVMSLFMVIGIIKRFSTL
jgi:hypothetical protein